MNLASWIILAIVVGVLALAVKATFFGKKGCSGCHQAGGACNAANAKGAGEVPLPAPEGEDPVAGLHACSSCPSSCGGCSGCQGCTFQL